MSRPRKYPRELLERGARLVFESNRPIAHVARDLGVPSETLRKYVRQIEADEGRRPDLPTSEEREEVRRLHPADHECWTRHQPTGGGVGIAQVPRRACSHGAGTYVAELAAHSGPLGVACTPCDPLR
jgi:transposase